MGGALSTLGSDRDLPHEIRDQQISARVQQSLEYADMAARESQIKDPFPDTFQWLLGEGGSEAREPKGQGPPPALVRRAPAPKG
jgi:hypothetical protein